MWSTVPSPFGLLLFVMIIIGCVAQEQIFMHDSDIYTFVFKLERKFDKDYAHTPELFVIIRSIYPRYSNLDVNRG